MGQAQQDQAAAGRTGASRQAGPGRKAALSPLGPPETEPQGGAALRLPLHHHSPQDHPQPRRTTKDQRPQP